MKFTGEFFVPPSNNDSKEFSHELQIEHLHRYSSILALAKDKIVLDIACGEGYGSGMLSKHAKQVYGVDINAELIAHASKTYGQKNISFLHGSAAAIPLPDQCVDMLVSFETIEHVPADIQTKFVSEAKRVLKPGGLMIISTPDKKNYTDRYGHHNEFHLKELYEEEFVALLKTGFAYVNLYGQGSEITSLILNKEEYQKGQPLSAFKIDEKAYNFEPKYFIALCSDDREKAHSSISSIIPETERSYLATIDRILALQKEVEELGEWGRRSNAELNDRLTEIKNLKKDLEKRANEIYKLDAAKRELEVRLQDIYSSDGWKMLSIYYRFKGKFLRDDSMVVKQLKSLKRRLKPAPASAPVAEMNPTKKYDLIPGVPADIKFPLAFPVYNNPEVSIIIPAYNNWEFTRNCLISIYQHTEDVTYEIIVGDNVSTDETVNLEKYFTNLLYLRNPENLGYIRNINNAASHAKGKYILTLNNDTTVTPNWLRSMIDIMDRDLSVGLVGSKLVFPDGTLQEAGGIVWKDAVGWNYGRDKNPDDPEYNYVKEVDYISGASNLVRKEIWDKLKGLDERYVPAYFDDSDLAFSIRNLGYKVVYQPLSKVIHYEGLTHGTNTNSGTKQYQILNKQKFIDKWQKELAQDQFTEKENVFWARDRSKYKKTILVIDHYVPQFDKDAGSRTVFQYLELLAELGYNVKFLGDNFYKHEPYTTILQQKGIEVLYGSYYAENWQKWILDNQKYIDYILLNRPHISIKYIDFLRSKTKSKILYYGHDLHYVREMKEYEVTKDKAKLKIADQWKKTEYKLFEKSDVILTPTFKEKELIVPAFRKKQVEVLPAFFYPEIAAPITNFNERKNILFVGGFTHTPNVDAVLWFAEKVFPIVCKQHPDIQFIIVGSNMPASIANLGSDNIIIKGYLSDDELKEIYGGIQLAIMPLRYGAGLKGKTVEAMVKGLPLVSTSFGLEGMIDVDNILQPNDTEDDFAQGILALYNKPAELQQLSARIAEYAKQHFTKASASVFFRSLFK
jgi:GT2 family glycosyltransferase/ubiquinone/menaquinone biosynthesis C-methylase UbiE